MWERFEWFQTPHFHNSALEVSVGLGIVGLVVYLVYLAMAAAVAVNTTIDAEVRLSLVSVLWLLIISSALDFTLLKHNSFATLFMFYCFFAAQRIYSGMNGPAGRPFRA